MPLRTGTARVLERLLESDAEAGSFLETPPEELNATLLARSSGDHPAASLDTNEAEMKDRMGDSVLQSLGLTIDAPRVMLRDADEQEAIRLNSPIRLRCPSRFPTVATDWTG